MKNIEFDFSHMMAENFEEKENAVSQIEISQNIQSANQAFEKIFENTNLFESAIFDTIQNPENIDEIQQFGEYVQKNFENVVVLGVGGSALGTRAIFSAVTDMAFKKNKNFRTGKPNWFVRDSMNPEKFQSLLDSLDLEKTLFFCVTKSGGTLETLSQLTVVLKRLEKNNISFSKNVCVITAHKKSKLATWAEANGVRIFWFSDDLSGRFSVLSAVGLVPAASVGVDIKKLLQGAKAMFEECSLNDIEKNPALKSAVLEKICIEKGLNVSYLMPYADSLKVFSAWWCQLWAESLGKCVVEGKNKKFFGQTPVSALGTVDQHSQLQLCLEGVYDKTITFLSVKNFARDEVVPEIQNGFLDPGFCGHTLSEICNASQKSTQDALLKRNRVSKNITLEKVDEFSLGGLFVFFMLETMFLGKMFGFETETYVQPSVELIKRTIKNNLKQKND